MQITFTLSEAKLDYFRNCKEAIILDAEKVDDTEANLYRVTFQFEEWMSIGMICQFFLYNGVLYGLDLKYSSYDNSISR